MRADQGTVSTTAKGRAQFRSACGRDSVAVQNYAPLSSKTCDLRQAKISQCWLERFDVGAEAGKYRRSEEHTSELQSLMRISYAVFCLKKKNINTYSNKT